MDILALVNEATKEANSFENHPAKDLSLEEKLLYLNGLALVMNVDEEIDDNEKEYLRILIKSFDMPDAETLEEFVRFAKEPDKDTIQAFFRAFRRRDIAKLFLFDALMLSRRDNTADEREAALINKLCEELEIPKGVYAEIYELFCHIINRDWDEAKSLFGLSPIYKEYFKHLLDYHEVSLEEVVENKTDALHKEMGFEWKEVKYRGNSLVETMRCSWYKPFTWGTGLQNKESSGSKDWKFLIAGPVTYSQFVRFLQFAVDSRDIRVQKDMVFSKKGYLKPDELLMDLNKAKIDYDPENKSFSCNDALKDKPITGFTPIGASTFAKAVNCNIGYGKKYSSSDDDVWFPLVNEEFLAKEIVLGYNGLYYFNKTKNEYIRWNDNDALVENQTDIPENAVFRVMKYGALKQS